MENPERLLEKILTNCTGSSLMVDAFQWQMGGDINRAASVRTSEQQFFIKWNEAHYTHMFEVEARGLQLLAAACPLRVPQVVGTGAVDSVAYLVLEHLEKGLQSNNYWQRLGEGLAALHLNKQREFGLDHNNYIGRLSQANEMAGGWLNFFIHYRLLAQLDLARENDIVSDQFETEYRSFLSKLPEILPESDASLLHGDLWSGNAMAVSPDEASIYDPAVYYGAREMDLAMTRLFGGFDSRFYQAYHSVYPIPDHFEDLVDIYNLYPLMVHVNLFGPDSGYAGSVSRIIRRYL